MRMTITFGSFELLLPAFPAGGPGPLHHPRPQNLADPRPLAPPALAEPPRAAAEALFRPLATAARPEGPEPGTDRPHDTGGDASEDEGEDVGQPPHPPVW